MSTERPPQYTISAKVTAEQKENATAFARERGCTQTEIIIRAFGGSLDHRSPLAEHARLHLAAVHAVRANPGKIDQAAVDSLIEATRELIAVARAASK